MTGAPQHSDAVVRCVASSGFAPPGRVEDPIAFHAATRRSRLVGQWAAEVQGLEGDVAESYAREFVETAAREPECSAYMQQVERALSALGVTRDEIAAKIRDLEVQARIETYAFA